MGGISSALNPGADEMVRQIQVDAFGNVYACGRIRQFADFSGTTVTTYGDYDIFLAKYNCHGGLVWVKTAGGSATDDAFSLALDGLGHIYLTGYLEADISIPNTFFDTLLTEYTTDMFLAKFDTSGNYLWGKFSGPGAQNTNAQGFNIVIDVNGNVNVHVSTATAGILFPGWPVNAAPYIAKFDTSGTLLQLFTFSSNYSLDATNFVMDAQNNYFICGFWSADTVILGSQTLYNPKPGICVLGYTAKFTSTGNLVWVYMLTDTTTLPAGTRPWGINLDSNSNILLSGKTTQGLKCGNYIFNNINGFNSTVPFLIKLNQSGQPIWAAQGYEQYVLYSRGGVALKNSGNSVFSSSYLGSAIFNSDSLPQSFNGSKDIFLAEVDPNGLMLGAVRLGCTGNKGEPYSTVTDPSDNVYLAGTFNGVLSANGNSVSSAGGYTDGFIAKYGTICTTGIEEFSNSSNSQLNIYPNPVSETLNISLNDNNINTISILNTLGQAVFKKQVIKNASENIQLSVSTFPPGIYIIQATGKNNSATAKFIKE